MGILGLARLIADVAPEAIKEIELKSLFGRRIAIDASMCIYQFLVAIRSNEYMMTNESGETTSHLVGIFYRSIKMLEIGIKPIYVFDGKAPKLKAGELTKRAERRSEAQEKLNEAKEVQDIENIQKLNKRLVKVTRKMNDDCKRLLQLLGLPIVQAPSEAEAQCVQLCKEGLVFAAATEDMDALTFGCPRLIRNLTSSNNEKVKEFQVDRVLGGLGITQDEFIDLSILMGCDYCENIKGIGGKKGLELIRKYHSIEKILGEKFNITEFVEVEIDYYTRLNENKDNTVEPAQEVATEEGNTDNGEKHLGEIEEKLEEVDVKMEELEEKLEEVEEKVEEVDENMDEENEENNEEDVSKGKEKKTRAISVPERWPFRGARKLFKEPLVLRNEITEKDLRLTDIDEEGLVEFLCKQNGFSEDRVRNAIKRAKEARSKSSQTRIDTFFKAKPTNGNQSSTKRIASDSKVNKSDNRTQSKRGRRGR